MCAQGASNTSSLPTLFFPGIFSKNEWNPGVPPAQANVYMGVLMLMLAGIAFLRERTPMENIFAAFGTLCALLSFADDLPLHRWAWNWFPGLNLFRFPNYYLYFTLLSTLLLAGGSLKEDARWRWGARRSLLIGTGCTLIVCMALLLWLPHHFPPAPADALRRSTFEWARALGYCERLHIGGIVTGPVLVIAFALAWYKRLNALTLLGLVFLEMGWNTHLSVWNSGVSSSPPSAVHAHLAQVPSGPVLPDLRPLAEHHDLRGAFHHLWRNTQTFLGLPAREGFNSFWPTHTDSLLNHHPDLVKAMDRQPMVYLTDKLVHESHRGQVPSDSSTVFVPQMIDADGERPAVPNDLHRSPEDRVAFTAFEYDRFALQTSTKAATFLTVQQTWFPGWSILIDDVPAEVVRANVAAFGALLPAGEHRVVVAFEKPLVPWLMGISMGTFVLALLLLAFTGPRDIRPWAVAGSVLVGGMLGWSLLAHDTHYDDAVRSAMLNASLAPHAEDAEIYALPSGPAMALHAGHEYSPAFRRLAGDLTRNGQRALVVDLNFEPRGRCKGLLVIQRTLNDRTVDYEAVPFVSSDTVSRGIRSRSFARDLRELRFPEEELAVYAWNLGPDTLLLHDLRIRTSPRNVWDPQ